MGFLKIGKSLNLWALHEILHSVKTKNLKVLILKLNLVMAFDQVNWTFSKLVLLQIGIPLEGANWIMDCVCSSNFVVLVNGNPTDFFPASRGLRRGCPLSPLLSILVIESLSLIISDAHRKGHIKGIQLSSRLGITHLFFVDDVILFGLGTVDEWLAFKEAIDLYCSATGMSISIEKSSFLYNDIDEQTRRHIATFLP